ncbi:MAG: HmuY family protein [Chlorobi bacterium]|nr:MAG: hypothetical protein UZ07_CHB004001040 [Chlorobi bacterium OLB7]MBK8910482.1 HmuY family protein [Chlorobiota bacterium]
MTVTRYLSSALLVAAIGLASCSDDAVVEPTPAPTQVSTIAKDIPGDTANTGHYTFYRLSDSSIVALSDSATTKWDIAFRGTSIILNGGSSGPGAAVGQMLTGVDFDTLSMAPEAGYSADAVGAPAVGKTWYSYDPATHLISIIPGKVIVLKTADGKYAKLQVLGYYKGAPAAPKAEDPARFFTFKYVIQTDGSRKLK